MIHDAFNIWVTFVIIGTVSSTYLAKWKRILLFFAASIKCLIEWCFKSMMQISASANLSPSSIEQRASSDIKSIFSNSSKLNWLVSLVAKRMKTILLLSSVSLGRGTNWLKNYRCHSLVFKSMKNLHVFGNCPCGRWQHIAIEKYLRAFLPHLQIQSQQFKSFLWVVLTHHQISTKKNCFLKAWHLFKHFFSKLNVFSPRLVGSSGSFLISSLNSLKLSISWDILILFKCYNWILTDFGCKKRLFFWFARAKFKQLRKFQGLTSTLINCQLNTYLASIFSQRRNSFVNKWIYLIGIT